MKRVFSLLLALILVGLLPAQAAGFCSNTAAINEACQSVMKLEVKDDRDDVIASASGFLAYDDQTLVTNCHVIERRTLSPRIRTRVRPSRLAACCVRTAITTSRFCTSENQRG